MWKMADIWQNDIGKRGKLTFWGNTG